MEIIAFLILIALGWTIPILLVYALIKYIRKK